MIIASIENRGEYYIYVTASTGYVESEPIHLVSLTIIAQPEEVFYNNIPPYFNENLESSVEIDLASSSSTSIHIPEYSDMNRDEVSISIIGLDELSFATFDQSEMLINIANVTDKDQGNYTIRVSISDGTLTTS